MKVDPPLWPQVPVAAHWQQSGRGAKKLPDDWLPLPQVDDNATTEEPRRKQRIMSAEETTKKTTTRTTEETTKKKTRASVSSQKSTKCQTLTPVSNPNMTKSTAEPFPKNRSSSSINIGTWNVRTLRKEGHWDILLEEARRFDVDILGLCETHLNEKETLINKDEFTILLSSRKDGIGREGVGLVISQPLLQCLISYETVSSRILTAKFKMKEGIVNIIQVYAPTSTHSEEVSDDFYDALQLQIQKVHKKESLIMMGDLNAKIGTDHNAWTPTLGKYGLGKINSRGEKLLEFCAFHKLAVCNTFFQHKECRRATWTSPCGKYRNMIDFIITQQENMNKFQNCRAYCSADVGSDHNLVLAKVILAPTKPKRMTTLSKNYDVSRFSNHAIAEEFRAKIEGAFEPLLQLENSDTEELWTKFRDTTNSITEATVGTKRARQVKGLPEVVRNACHQRRKARILTMNKANSELRDA